MPTTNTLDPYGVLNVSKDVRVNFPKPLTINNMCYQCFISTLKMCEAVFFFFFFLAIYLLLTRSLGHQATLEEIKQSYRQLAQAIHPDKQPAQYQDHAKKRFADILESFEVKIAPIHFSRIIFSLDRLRQLMWWQTISSQTPISHFHVCLQQYYFVIFRLSFRFSQMRGSENGLMNWERTTLKQFSTSHSLT
jgi:hypothetical protein